MWYVYGQSNWHTDRKTHGWHATASAFSSGELTKPKTKLWSDNDHEQWLKS